MYQYEHGGSQRFLREDLLDFSVNINPLGLPKGLNQAVQAAMEDVIYYPDCFNRNLRNAIAKYENIAIDHIFCGNGASDIIFRICYAKKAKTALVLAPTFSDYERALRASGCEQVIYHYLQESLGFQPDESLEKQIQDGKYDLIFLCNPNNPTGCVMTRGKLEKIAKVVEGYGGTLVVDECFLDFVVNKQEISLLPLVGQYPNLMVLKAFTKFFAMPGFRLGYAISSNQEWLESLYQYGADWTVSTFAQYAGIEALRDDSYRKKAVEFVAREREFLQIALQGLGCTIYESKANYIFFGCPSQENLDNILLEHYNIAIRSCSNYVGLGRGYYRIGIKNRKENEKIVSALQKIMIQ